MTVDEHRRDPRLQHRAKIRVSIPSLSEQLLLDMRDFSKSGLFLLWSENANAEIGMIVEVQTTEFEDAPVQTAKIVRIQAGVGIAAEFIDPT